VLVKRALRDQGIKPSTNLPREINQETEHYVTIHQAELLAQALRTIQLSPAPAANVRRFRPPTPCPDMAADRLLSGWDKARRPLLLNRDCYTVP
jgi:hypothetical protein